MSSKKLTYIEICYGSWYLYTFQLLNKFVNKYSMYVCLSVNVHVTTFDFVFNFF